jgi:glycosyltransferase involved in cell wall biosynthesis
MHAVCVVHDVERIDRSVGGDYAARIQRASDLTVVHNDFSKEALMRTTAMARRVVVIPHGNYIAQYPNRIPMATARAALGVAPDRFVILFFGNPRETKGLHILLEALGRLSRSEISLLIAGKMRPDFERHYRDLTARFGVTERVRFDVKHVEDRELPYYFGAADIVALPYTKIYESGVCVMAMSLGRPLIASDLPPLVDAIGGGRHGLLFKAGDAADLADKIDAAFNMSKSLLALGEAGHEYVRHERSWSQAGRSLYEHLACQVSQSSRAAARTA